MAGEKCELGGGPDFEQENEEGSLFETESPLVKEPLPVVYNQKIPIETFDFIVIDECHRSIYNLRRQVLEYSDAFLIGLTATPTPQTIGFFKDNLVMEYGHGQAVADGINVGFDVYRIRTQTSDSGSTLTAESGRFVPPRDKRTREKRLSLRPYVSGHRITAILATLAGVDCRISAASEFGHW